MPWSGTKANSANLKRSQSDLAPRAKCPTWPNCISQRRPLLPSFYVLNGPKQSKELVSRESSKIAALTNTEAKTDRGRAILDRTLNSPHKFDCLDNNTYVVKPALPDRQFANELLGLALGTILGVPLFDAALVNISSALMQASPLLATSDYKPGIHFGSRVPNSENFNFRNVSPALVKSNIRNAEDFYRLVVLDELSYNGDREPNPGNLVAVRLHDSAPQLEFFAIDHGFLFGGCAWTTQSLDACPLTPLIPVMAVVQEVLTSRARLVTVAHEAAALAIQFSATVNQARTNLSADEKAAVVR